jgi:aryl-alcohol dehydrogenase-like predicted oxidoreductase
VCEQDDVAYAAFGPLAGGWLTGKYRRGEAFPGGSRMTQRPEPYERFVNDSIFDALETLERMARAHGVSMAGMSLAWLLGEPRLDAVVVGPTRPEHLEPVREALAHPLDAATRDELSRVFARWR